MTVDPSRRYRLVNGRISFPDRADEHTLAVTYHDAQDVFVPETNRFVLSKPSENYVAEQVSTFDLPQEFNIPEDEFHLEYYGFDESVLVPLSPNRWLRWLLMGGGAASLVVGYWLLTRRRANS
jgi:hypothetical protein